MIFTMSQSNLLPDTGRDSLHKFKVTRVPTVDSSSDGDSGDDDNDYDGHTNTDQ